ncbi:hypothetical protein C8R43DRAFT_1120826 [Mycena crocata]|nr:hypothetical protein C8R43DRAFT_1120826 [Mycena crocata]
MIQKGGGVSKRVRQLGSAWKNPAVPGRPPMTTATVSQEQLEDQRRRGEKSFRQRLNMMDVEQREALNRLQTLAEDDEFNAGILQDAPGLVNDILDGSSHMEMSHAGGEHILLRDGIAEEATEAGATRYEDWCTRRDRTETRNLAFLSEMPEMVTSYLRFCAEREMPMRPQSERKARQPTMEAEEEIWELDVVDMFETKSVEVKLNPTGGGVAPALILEGLMPCAPTRPSVAIKYAGWIVCCPQLAIQSWVKSLCNIHGVAYKPYLCQQFSIAYDLYLDIRRRVDERVLKALRRDSSWRLKHACPACTYKLEGEDTLIFELLTTMDGNDSLKRVLRREKGEENESGEPTLGKSRERVDHRDAGDGYMISREKVDKWAKTRLANMLPMQGGNSDTDNPCADRWKNMVNDVPSKMWGIFDETGIFLALCRHGFVLVLADMVRSGEVYPLAVVEELLEVFGMNLGAGYDIGCHFGATVEKSELSEEAQEKNLKCLVGSFHGHAHNRLCQLSFLATYVEGMGLEDLEGCECFFSRSNGLAKSCRYASRFHRQQEITTYAKHFDSFETYANLSKFLCTNYRQALAILKTEPTLVVWMRQEGVPNYETFHQWLLEEKAYLLSLKNAPKTNTETIEMEYMQKLVNLSASQAKYSVVAAEAKKARSDDAPFVPGVSKADLARRHAKEKMMRELDSVIELEDILNITERWTTASPKWVATVKAIRSRKYQLALDGLELLIVERIFELTKMNQSQTGYKMRKHIAKALQARSKAVKNAIDTYNAAAMVMSPPMPELTWEQVVEYAFLADFDILRDTREEVRSRPWTQPAYRMAMDRYFKLLRAKEEIKRLNERELKDTEGKTVEEVERGIQMAVQVKLYQERRGRFDDGHMRRFWRLAETPGFTGSLRPGVAVERREAREATRAAARRAEEEREMDVDEVVTLNAEMGSWRRAEEQYEEEGWEDEENEESERTRVGSAKNSDEEGEGNEAREVELSGLLYRVSMLAVDDNGGADSGDEA